MDGWILISLCVDEWLSFETVWMFIPHFLSVCISGRTDVILFMDGCIAVTPYLNGRMTVTRFLSVWMSGCHLFFLSLCLSGCLDVIFTLSVHLFVTFSPSLCLLTLSDTHPYHYLFRSLSPFTSPSRSPQSLRSRWRNATSRTSRRREWRSSATPEPTPGHTEARTEVTPRAWALLGHLRPALGPTSR